MAQPDFEKYAVRKPVYEAFSGVKNRQSPTMTLISSPQIPEANYYLTLGWIYGIPDPNPHIFEHVHDYDEIILHVGGNPETPQVLGGEIEFYIGGQPITFNTTTGIFIPKGTPHGPLTWKKFDYPHLQMSLMLGAGKYSEAEEKRDMDEGNKGLPRKTARFDFEQYVIRSPLRESGDSRVTGRQNPTMTYMSSTQINIAKYYIEFGWIWDIVSPPIYEMVHKNYDEIVLHIGGDWKNPEDLGADIEFGIGGQLFNFDTTFGVYIPRTVRHCPINWKKVGKPHIEMAIMLGCGTLAEGWENNTLGRAPGVQPV